MDLYGSVNPPRAPLQGRPSALNAEQRNDLFNDSAVQAELVENQQYLPTGPEIGSKFGRTQNLQAHK